MNILDARKVEHWCIVVRERKTTSSLCFELDKRFYIWCYVCISERYECRFYCEIVLRENRKRYETSSSNQECEEKASYYQNEEQRDRIRVLSSNIQTMTAS